jgi:hypothetical protein
MEDVGRDELRLVRREEDDHVGHLRWLNHVMLLTKDEKKVWRLLGMLSFTADIDGSLGLMGKVLPMLPGIVALAEQALHHAG